MRDEEAPMRMLGTWLGGAPSREVVRPGTVLEPRERHVYVCCFGHETSVVFHAEAVPPVTWECRACRTPGTHKPQPGQSAQTFDNTEPEFVAKTHWDRVRQRRSDAQLEALLERAQERFRSGAEHDDVADLFGGDPLVPSGL